MPKKTPSEKKSFNPVEITFHGGAGEVTGACYQVSFGNTSILIDCGMFQGHTALEEENQKKFFFTVSDIQAVFITHSHIDHIGRLPKLIKEGFRGTIYSTAPTKELSEVLLLDALHFTKENGPYEEKDVARVMERWKSLNYHEPITLDGFSIVLRNAGHILGSSMIEIHADGKSILFTGDLGNVPSVLLPPPEKLPDGIQYLITESTYGNKIHHDVENRSLLLERAIEDIVTRGGALMIPAFATERTQDILYEMNEMMVNNRVPKILMFLDSPLATKATEVFNRHIDYYSDTVKEIMKKTPDMFSFKGLTFTESVEESKRINDTKNPKVVLAGSGMSTGGRILHHEMRYLPDANSILLIAGFQSNGSLGRRLIDGAKEVRIFKETVPVRAEIRQVAGYSAHADSEQLFSFIKNGKDTLKKVLVVQGEQDAAEAIAQRIKDSLGIPAEIPALYEKVVLE